MSGYLDIASDAGPTFCAWPACDDRGMPRRVLVVDDDPNFRGLAARIIASDGIEISEAGTVATAIEVAREIQPGAALVDVGLPDGDGIDLACQLSAMPWKLHIVLTSSDPDAVSSDELRACGADAFVPKDKLSDVPLRRILAL
jgi:DNA-binding response OmpR family regulator